MVYGDAGHTILRCMGLGKKSPESAVFWLSPFCTAMHHEQEREIIFLSIIITSRNV
jgi:hypothetical protein